jgi:methionine-gamma-lyase
VDEGIAIFTNKKEGHVYSRYGNPTMEAVARKIAQLETAGLPLEAAAVMFSSGMAAISTLALALLKPGDRILTQGNLYGGTTELFVKIFQPLGIGTILTDLQNLEQVESMVKNDPKIKLIYFETPANPTIACIDIDGIASIAAQYDRITAVDNTFATPYLQQPFKYGIDYIIHSTTKFLNGHGNSIAGIVVTTHTRQMQMGGAVWNAMKLTGTNCNPWDAWLVHNGLKTLAVRMDRHCENALTIAQFLEKHPKVSKVNYCGLPTHPDYEIAKKQMRASGGMLSFEIADGLEAGIQFMNAIRMCTLAPTLGDVDTLILHPASMSHLNIPKEVRLANGITDGLIRLSVGIEYVDDIINDLAEALEVI